MFSPLSLYPLHTLRHYQFAFICFKWEDPCGTCNTLILPPLFKNSLLHNCIKLTKDYINYEGQMALVSSFTWIVRMVIHETSQAQYNGRFCILVSQWIGFGLASPRFQGLLLLLASTCWVHFSLQPYPFIIIFFSSSLRLIPIWYQSCRYFSIALYFFDSPSSFLFLENNTSPTPTNGT